MKHCLLIFTIIFILPFSIKAAIPNTLNYQGRLMNSTQQPVTDGQYSVTFRLYAAESGGTMVWEEAQSVATQNGYFNTVLGNSTALTPSIFNQPLWVGIQVGTNAEMTPRQKLGTSAYAMTVADGAITANKVASGWGVVPSGTIVMWPMETAPDGWMECAGNRLSTSSYPHLFAAIGYSYGGSGTDFNIPDFRGYFPRGWSHGAGVDPDATSRTARGDGATGDIVGTKQDFEIQSHDHRQKPAIYGTTAGTMSVMRGVYGMNEFTEGCEVTGGNETRPKNIAMMFIIKQ
ncbi:phage tail protein [bacterium]|nr:phage tail protein [bacterium]